MVAGVHGPLLGVVEATALVVHLDGLGRLACLDFTKERREHMNAQGSPAPAAGGVPGPIDPFFGNGRIAGIASKRRSVLSRAQANSLARANNTRIADSVMKRTFFIIERSHDVADQKDQTAQNLSEIPPKRSKIRDRFARRADYF